MFHFLLDYFISSLISNTGVSSPEYFRSLAFPFILLLNLQEKVSPTINFILLYLKISQSIKLIPSFCSVNCKNVSLSSA